MYNKMIFNKMKNSNLHRMREITQEPLLTLPESWLLAGAATHAPPPLPPFSFSLQVL